MGAAKRKFRQDIQGLRALAVIMVIIFHFNADLLPGGFIGVDVFFVISGYLLSRSIIQQRDAGNFDLWRFFRGRIKRIVPAYYFLLIVVLAVAVAVYPANFFDIFYGQFRHTALFISNRIFGMGINYFGPGSSEMVLLHTWSLSIEMQFYFLLPFVFILSPKKWRFGVLLFIFLVLLAYTQYNLSVLELRTKMYFSLPARSLEFIVGMLINFLPSSQKYSKKALGPLSVLAFFIILASGWSITGSSLFPGVTALPACASTAFIIWAERTEINNMLGGAPAAYIGDLSYSLYLWHWPVLAFYRFLNMDTHIGLLTAFLLCILFFALAAASYYLVEEPFRRLKGRKFYIRTSAFILSIWVAYLFSLRVNEKLIPIPREYIKPIELTNHHKYDGYILVGDTTKADDHIFIVGDSHALSLRPFFERLGKKNGLNFSFITMNSYVPLKGLPDSIQIDNPKFELTVYEQLSTYADERIKTSNIVIIMRHWLSDYHFENILAVLENELSPTQSVVILEGFPGLEQDPVRKYISFTKPKDFVTEKLREPKIPKEVSRFVKEHPQFYLWNIYNKEFFKEAPFYRDTLMYNDAGHINFYGAERLAEVEGDQLAEFLKELLADNRKEK